MPANLDPVLIAILAAPLILALAAVFIAMRPKPPQSDPGLMELAGRVAHMAEETARSQAILSERLQSQEREVTKALDERLGSLGLRIGEALNKQTNDAEKTMGDLKERLAAITAAQGKITELSQQVVSLQDVLTNKQARGAFGETQLEDLVRQALPPNAFAFQVTLGNGKRADCLLNLPNPPGPIVVDAKFPLESFYRLRQGKEGPERDAARKMFGQDVLKHVKDIAERYIVAEETADSALMFLPSEAVYAELHGELPQIVEQSHRARVYIVSPTTLMATLNTMRAVLKDAQMREQAHLIQREVRRLSDDVTRLDDRVGKLQSHFRQADDDIRQIRISTEKIQKTSEKIEALELGEPVEAADIAAPVPAAAPRLID